VPSERGQAPFAPLGAPAHLAARLNEPGCPSGSSAGWPTSSSAEGYFSCGSPPAERSTPDAARAKYDPAAPDGAAILENKIHWLLLRDLVAHRLANPCDAPAVVAGLASPTS